MKSKNWNRFTVTIACLFLLIAAVILLNAQAPDRGTVTVINGNTITVKTDSGDSKQAVSAERGDEGPERGRDDSSSPILRRRPGAGERDPNATGAIPQALQRVARRKPISPRSSEHKERDQVQAGLVKSLSPHISLW